MSKIAIITDTHFGARGDSLIFHEYFKEFYEKTFFPYLIENKIDTIIHCGDTFDRRKYINFNSLYHSSEYFFGRAEELNIELHTIIGNHDTYYRNTNLVNSGSLLLSGYDNISIHSEPSEVVIKDKKFLLIPWICADNRDKTVDLIGSTKANVVLGHLELSGFKMYKDSFAHGGEDPTSFERFAFVGSGHFHHKNTKGNIHYFGSPYQITWSDYGETIEKSV